MRCGCCGIHVARKRADRESSARRFTLYLPDGRADVAGSAGEGGANLLPDQKRLRRLDD
jgi:hypothetical protein